MPILRPETGDGATPNRSLLVPGGGALRLMSAAGMNFAPESESANADASRDTGVADWALSEVFEPLALVSAESANAMALRGEPDVDCAVLEGLSPAFAAFGSAIATVSVGWREACEADCPTPGVFGLA